MAQPLMVTSSPTHVSVPPAQAEALYDAALENSTKDTSSTRERPAAWPGEDWDDPLSLPSPLPRPPTGSGSGRFL